MLSLSLLMVLLLLLLETIILQHLLHFDCPPQNGSTTLIRTPYWGVVDLSVPSFPEPPSVVMLTTTEAVAVIVPIQTVAVMDTLWRDRVITKMPNAHLRSRKNFRYSFLWSTPWQQIRSNWVVVVIISSSSQSNSIRRAVTCSSASKNISAANLFESIRPLSILYYSKNDYDMIIKKRWGWWRRIRRIPSAWHKTSSWWLMPSPEASFTSTLTDAGKSLDWIWKDTRSMWRIACKRSKALSNAW